MDRLVGGMQTSGWVVSGWRTGATPLVRRAAPTFRLLVVWMGGWWAADRWVGVLGVISMMPQPKTP